MIPASAESLRPAFPGTLTAERIGELVGRRCRLAVATAIDQGDAPFACIITDLDGNELITAINTTRSDPQQPKHAEINAIAAFKSAYPGRSLADCSVFSNAVSCADCFTELLGNDARGFFYGDLCSITSRPLLSLADMRDMLIAAPNGTEHGWLVAGIFGAACRRQIELGRVAINNPLLRGAAVHQLGTIDNPEREAAPIIGPVLSAGLEGQWQGWQAWPAAGAAEENFLAHIGAAYNDQAKTAVYFGSGGLSAAAL